MSKQYSNNTQPDREARNLVDKFCFLEKISSQNLDFYLWQQWEISATVQVTFNTSSYQNWRVRQTLTYLIKFCQIHNPNDLYEVKDTSFLFNFHQSDLIKNQNLYLIPDSNILYIESIFPFENHKGCFIDYFKRSLTFMLESSGRL